MQIAPEHAQGPKAVVTGEEGGNGNFLIKQIR